MWAESRYRKSWGLDRDASVDRRPGWVEPVDATIVFGLSAGVPIKVLTFEEGGRSTGRANHCPIDSVRMAVEVLRAPAVTFDTCVTDNWALGVSAARFRGRDWGVVVVLVEEHGKFVRKP